MCILAPMSILGQAPEMKSTTGRIAQLQQLIEILPELPTLEGLRLLRLYHSAVNLYLSSPSVESSNGQKKETL